MKTKVRLYNGKWMGTEVSDYGLKNGYIDYKTLAENVGDMILCNDICKLFYRSVDNSFIEPEFFNGNNYNEEEDNYTDMFQYFIISSQGAKLLQQYTDETVYYIDYLDMYIWAITHYGTSWEYVLTDIEIEK